MIYHDAKKNIGISSKGQPLAWFIGWFIAIASWKAKNTFLFIIMEKSGIMAFQDAIGRIHGEYHWLSKGRVDYATGKSTNSTGHSFQEYYLVDVW